MAGQRRRREASEKVADYATMCQRLTSWHHAGQTAWLRQGPIHPLQQTLRRLDAAYHCFFAGQDAPPKFKRRGQEPGLRFPETRTSSRSIRRMGD